MPFEFRTPHTQTLPLCFHLLLVPQALPVSLGLPEGCCSVSKPWHESLFLTLQGQNVRHD